MAGTLHSLTDKAMATLRLILQGHDAKSMASELGLSVHTINERLRKARRKLQVTSSKEAARLLLGGEGAEHKPLVSIDLGATRQGETRQMKQHRNTVERRGYPLSG